MGLLGDEPFVSQKLYVGNRFIGGDGPLVGQEPFVGKRLFGAPKRFQQEHMEVLDKCGAFPNFFLLT